jgi:ribosome biogenesis GTPase A
MAKAKRELAALVPSQDVVIEVLDARLPGASSNPLLRELRGDKPCVKVLARSDLADPVRTELWLAHLRREPNVQAFAADSSRGQETRKRISELCKDTARWRGPDKAVRALITGVPNVGKSTLINTLMQRSVAAVGDKPAVTKTQQTVTLKDGMKLTDSPGLMWPKIEDERNAFRLAFAGSIPETALDYLSIGRFGAAVLLESYASLLVARYKLTETPESAEALLDTIARRRGGLRPGGEVDLHKAAEILVRDFRSGALGRITLELPGS